MQDRNVGKVPIFKNAGLQCWISSDSIGQSQMRNNSTFCFLYGYRIFTTRCFSSVTSRSCAVGEATIIYYCRFGIVCQVEQTIPIEFISSSSFHTLWYKLILITIDFISIKQILLAKVDGLEIKGKEILKSWAQLLRLRSLPEIKRAVD